MLAHVTCVVLDGKGVLLAGAPGAGKSDLALRLIDEGAELLADDQTILTKDQGALMATPPQPIEGLIEIRHVGLAEMAFIRSAPVALYVDLVATDVPLERLPEPQTVMLCDLSVRRLTLPAFAASTPAKIRAALTLSFKN